MESAGVLERLQHGVYRLAGAPEVHNEGFFAQWVSISPDVLPAERSLWPEDGVAVFAGVAAAHLHQIGDLTVHETEFVTPTRRRSRQQSVRFRVEHLSNTDVTLVDGAPVLTIPRLVKDLLVGSYPVDLSLIGDLVRDALRDGKTSMFELASVLAEVDPTTRAALEGYVQERLQVPQYV